MKREELEHVLRACADIVKEHSFVVIGSQAILLPYPTAPEDDLALSRAVAARNKDANFVRGLLRHKMIEPAKLLESVRMLEPHRCDPVRVASWLQRRIEEAKS
jgi:hypothetical protein